MYCAALFVLFASFKFFVAIGKILSGTLFFPDCLPMSSTTMCLPCKRAAIRRH